MCAYRQIPPHFTRLVQACNRRINNYARRPIVSTRATFAGYNIEEIYERTTEGGSFGLMSELPLSFGSTAPHKWWITTSHVWLDS